MEMLILNKTNTTQSCLTYLCLELIYEIRFIWIILQSLHLYCVCFTQASIWSLFYQNCICLHLDMI